MRLSPSPAADVQPQHRERDLVHHHWEEVLPQRQTTGDAGGQSKQDAPVLQPLPPCSKVSQSVIQPCSSEFRGILIWAD